MLCVEFLQVQYIDLREIVHVLKAVTVVTNVHFVNLSTIFVVSHFLSAKVSPEWRLHPGFGTNNVPFSSIEMSHQ